MAYDTYNFPDHESGDTFEGVTFTVLVNAVALDLTAATVVFTFSKNGATYTASTTNGMVSLTDPANGVFKFDEQTISYVQGTYCYDVIITLASGEVKTYIKGTWKITR